MALTQGAVWDSLFADPSKLPEPPDATGAVVIRVSDGRMYFEHEVAPKITELEPFMFRNPPSPESGWLMTGEITMKATNGLLRYRIIGWRDPTLVLELIEGEITGPPPDVAG